MPRDFDTSGHEAIAVARKFDKESIQSRDKFEKYFNSVFGVQEAIALLPISFVGWGTRELGAVWLLGLVGISKKHALAMSLAYGLWSFARVVIYYF